MKIAVNAKALQITSGYSFIIECIQRIAAENPAHQFIFIVDKKPAKHFDSLKNIETIVLGKEAKTLLRWRFWYNYQLPSFLKKNNIDLLINADGFCSLRTKLPQLLIINDVSFLIHPEFISKGILKFYKKFFQTSIEKSNQVIVSSNYARDEILKSFAVDGSKIDVVYNVPSNVRPFNDNEETIKEKYTDGKEFFLYSGDIGPLQNITNLLKAFSFFKKRQKSNMQLVLTVDSSDHLGQFSESLKTYKYRDDLKLFKDLPGAELAAIMQTAYAFLYPVLSGNSGMEVLKAMQHNIPAVVSDIELFHEICMDAALYSAPGNVESLADNMMLLFKDEKKRNKLIEKGRQRLLQYDPNKSAAQLWSAILKTAQQ